MKLFWGKNCCRKCLATLFLFFALSTWANSFRVSFHDLLLRCNLVLISSYFQVRNRLSLQSQVEHTSCQIMASRVLYKNCR